MARRRSLSSWRAWIEIVRRAVHARRTVGRSPHGERGLKYTILVKGGVVEQSLSSWRAWIEMFTSRLIFRTVAVALLMESVD